MVERESLEARAEFIPDYMVSSQLAAIPFRTCISTKLLLSQALWARYLLCLRHFVLLIGLRPWYIHTPQVSQKSNFSRDPPNHDLSSLHGHIHCTGLSRRSARLCQTIRQSIRPTFPLLQLPTIPIIYRLYRFLHLLDTQGPASSKDLQDSS